MAATDTLTRLEKVPPGRDSPLLRVRDLTVQFRAGRKEWVTAVQDVSFDVAAGESVALVGESGSGKTVSSLAVMGLTGDTGGRVSHGSVEFDGRDLVAGTPAQWRALRGTGMGMIFQQPIRSLNPAYTVAIRSPNQSVSTSVSTARLRWHAQWKCSSWCRFHVQPSECASIRTHSVAACASG